MPQHPFYNSKTWRDAREAQLRREPHCRVCRMLGIRTRAVEVDHILAIASGGHPTDSSNLRSLCRKHHSQKTILIDGMHAGSGKKLVTTGADGWPVDIEQRRKPNGNSS